mgnify:CR=1 FL=1
MIKRNYKIILFLILVIFFSFIKLYSQENKNFHVYIKINKKVLESVIENDQDKVKNLIKKYIQGAYNKALNDAKNGISKITNKNGSPTKDIHNSISRLVTEIENYNNPNAQNKKVIVIMFYIDDEFLEQYGDGPFTINDFADPDHKVTGYKFGDKNCHGGTNNVNYIFLYNSYLDFTYKEIKASDPYNNGCNYKALVYDINPPKSLEPGWVYTGQKPQFSMASAIFHELTHISLNCYGNSNTKSRYRDEATIEEIMLKLYPHGIGINAYEYLYYWQLYWYRFGLKTKFENMDRSKAIFQFKDDVISRKFNPPDTLKYNRIENEIDYYTLGKYIDKDKNIEWFSDDCRDVAMKKYVIPYFICCNGQSQKSYSMRALSSDDDECDPECPGGGKVGSPGGDAADDRYSFSEGIVREYNLAPEAVIFTDGYWQDALKLYGGLKFDGDNAAEQLLEATPFLVIPSGGLFSKEQDSTFKAILEKYVSLGGTIIVFAQQYGSHIENVVPIPEGESLKVYGWRESQSISS